MNNPLISVIIPNYCHAKYLDQRIQSVLNQTYQNFEVIILDDASPDNGASKAVIEKYRENPHVSHIVYNKHNSGTTFKQWHKGFELAKGEYCWIAESDDFCDQDLLEKLMEEILKYKNVSIATCLSQFVDESGKKIGYIIKECDTVEHFEGTEFIRKKMLHDNSIYNASSAVFSRAYALSLNPFYMNFTAAGDRLFWIELAEKGDVIVLNSPKNYFRQHGNNVTPAKYRSGTTSMEDYKIVRYLEKKGYVRFSEHFSIRDKYLEDINFMQFENENIRKNLIKLWTYNGFIKRRLMWYLLNFYYKITNRGVYHQF